MDVAWWIIWLFVVSRTDADPAPSPPSSDDSFVAMKPIFLTKSSMMTSANESCLTSCHDCIHPTTTTRHTKRRRKTWRFGTVLLQNQRRTYVHRQPWHTRTILLMTTSQPIDTTIMIAPPRQQLLLLWYHQSSIINQFIKVRRLSMLRIGVLKHIDGLSPYYLVTDMSSVLPH